MQPKLDIVLTIRSCLEVKPNMFQHITYYSKAEMKMLLFLFINYTNVYPAHQLYCLGLDKIRLKLLNRLILQ